MKSPKASPPWWFFWAVFLFCAALNAGLLETWTRDPSNRYGSSAFLVWAVGIGLLARPPRGPAARVPLWILSLVLCVAGQIGSLQALKQAGLAVLLAGTIRAPIPATILLAAAASWTPAWGWAASHFLGNPLDSARPVFALGCFVAARLLAGIRMRP